ncbi:MAG: hypothetical protein MUP47_01805 [Phycisphaerae bacterium]|nr:hypothetical protein [Phycisphaerae bacterium]
MSRHRIISWVAMGALAAGTTWAFAQARSGVQVTTPGAMRGIGERGAVATFRQYSYGLGALQAPTVTPAANPLRSAIESRAVYNIARGGGEAPSPMGRSLLAPLPTGLRLYQPAPTVTSDLGAVGYGAPPSTSGSRLLRATSSYLSTLGGQQEVGIATRLGPITSLASGQADQFSTYMSQGEKAFRSGDFEEALEQFKMANSIDPKNPESLLSLAQTTFALSRSSYYRASYYLSRAVKYLPELPLAPLEPKSFFASQEQYTERLDGLDKHLASNPFDNDAFFVAAYFHWFDGDVEGARAALAKARRGKISDDLREAVDAFWDGMKASGKVSGTLDGLPPPPPAGPQAPSSQPTGPAEQAPAAPPSTPQATG